jgi:putative phosphoribosyl transferase
MYFASRLQVGRTLAARLKPKYEHEKCAIIALSDGGVMVGAQIASELHCIITLLMSAEINLPREPISVAGITPGGVLSYNHHYSQGELDELVGEYRGYVEQEKMRQMHELNQLVDGQGTIDKKLLNEHTIIIVSDGLSSSFQIDLCYEFLKPIAINKLVFAVPMATVQAIDRMHILADEIVCLNVLDEIPSTDHYYDKQDVPDHDTVLKTIGDLVANW